MRNRGLHQQAIFILPIIRIYRKDLICMDCHLSYKNELFVNAAVKRASEKILDKKSQINYSVIKEIYSREDILK